VLALVLTVDSQRATSGIVFLASSCIFAVRPIYPALVGAVLLLGSCKIQRTPLSYIDHQAIPEELLEASRSELEGRLRSTVPLMQEGAPRAIAGALRPARDVDFLDAEGGPDLRTPAQIGESLARLAAGREVEMRAPVIVVAPGNDVAWFRTAYELRGPEGGMEEVRFTGVWARRDGEWLLVQGHLSPFRAPAPADLRPAAEAG
jgi:hypothetical protein